MPRQDGHDTTGPRIAQSMQRDALEENRGYQDVPEARPLTTRTAGTCHPVVGKKCYESKSRFILFFSTNEARRLLRSVADSIGSDMNSLMTFSVADVAEGVHLSTAPTINSLSAPTVEGLVGDRAIERRRMSMQFTSRKIVVPIAVTSIFLLSMRNNGTLMISSELGKIFVWPEAKITTRKQLVN